MSTRSANSPLNLIREAPGTEHLVIAGRKLPTFKQVLLCFLAHRDKARREDESKKRRITRKALDAVIDQISTHYKNAGIDIAPHLILHNRITALYNEFVNLRKIVRKNRKTNVRLTKFQAKLSKTMPCWPRDIFKQLEKRKSGKSEIEKKGIDEDILFLKNMMTERTGLYTAKDMIVSNIMERRESRKTYVEGLAAKREEALAKEMEESMRKAQTIAEMYDAEDDAAVADDANRHRCEDTRNTRAHRRTLKTGVNIFVPHDILKHEKVVSCCTRNNITPTAITSFLRVLITECGGDANALSLNFRTAYR